MTARRGRRGHGAFTADWVEKNPRRRHGAVTARSRRSHGRSAIFSKILTIFTVFSRRNGCFCVKVPTFRDNFPLSSLTLNRFRVSISAKLICWCRFYVFLSFYSNLTNNLAILSDISGGSRYFHGGSRVFKSSRRRDGAVPRRAHGRFGFFDEHLTAPYGAVYGAAPLPYLLQSVVRAAASPDECSRRRSCTCRERARSG